jgi:hypothetical protein
MPSGSITCLITNANARFADAGMDGRFDGHRFRIAASR